VAAVLTAQQVLTRVWSALERIEATLDDNGVEDWTADRQLCLEDVQSVLSALAEEIEAGLS
jgi:hypothetical protein